MAFLNGTEAAGERRAADDTESGQAGPKPGVQSEPEDVTITIRGSMAARMLGRGDAEERILAELSELRQHLNAMEAGAALRAAQDAALRQTVEELHGAVAQLSGRVADQAAELSRLRSAFDSHALSVVHLPGQGERMHGQVNLLAGELGKVRARLDDLENRLPAPPSILGGVARGHGASDAKPGLAGILGRWRQPHKASANGEASADGSWLKQRLNSLWLW